MLKLRIQTTITWIGVCYHETYSNAHNTILALWFGPLVAKGFNGNTNLLILTVKLETMCRVLLVSLLHISHFPLNIDEVFHIAAHLQAEMKGFMKWTMKIVSLLPPQNVFMMHFVTKGMLIHYINSSAIQKASKFLLLCNQWIQLSFYVSSYY